MGWLKRMFGKPESPGYPPHGATVWHLCHCGAQAAMAGVARYIYGRCWEHRDVKAWSGDGKTWTPLDSCPPCRAHPDSTAHYPVGGECWSCQDYWKQVRSNWANETIEGVV